MTHAIATSIPCPEERRSPAQILSRSSETITWPGYRGGVVGPLLKRSPGYTGGVVGQLFKRSPGYTGGVVGQLFKRSPGYTGGVVGPLLKRFPGLVAEGSFWSYC